MAQPITHLMWLNPEPWAIGSITPRKGGARISPNLNLVAYQSAVKELLDGVPMLPESHRKLTFYFWRQQARYLDTNDKIRSRNQADATNMQKALEDALQGVLFENDRDVRDIRSVIVDQGNEVDPRILIVAERFAPLSWMDEIPFEALTAKPEVVQSDNVWRGPTT